MVTLSIIAIIVALAGPPYRQFIQNQRLSATASDLQRGLTLARTEAISRAARVVVCTSNNNTACTSGPWSDGWIVFVDRDGSGTLTDSATNPEPILLVQQGPLRNVSSKAVGVGALVSYGGSGYSRPVSPNSVDEVVTGRVLFCDNRGAGFARAVWVTATGIPRVDSPDAADTTCP